MVFTEKLRAEVISSQILKFVTFWPNQKTVKTRSFVFATNEEIGQRLITSASEITEESDKG